MLDPGDTVHSDRDPTEATYQGDAVPPIVGVLRKLADWLEAHPEVAPVHVSSVHLYGDVPEATLVLGSREEFRALAKALGKAEKQFIGDYFQLGGDIGGVALTASGERSAVCRRVVKGTRTVEAELVPAHEEEIVEYVCDDPLLKVAA